MTVQCEKEKVTLAKADIEKQTPSAMSLMPDSLLQTMSSQDLRNLFAYLQSESQVELK